MSSQGNTSSSPAGAFGAGGDTGGGGSGVRSGQAGRPGVERSMAPPKRGGVMKKILADITSSTALFSSSST
ncbi:conserved hypothetical protein [Ricinus communis]|uniref:Uncharacterized protein n=1 Tax=Ricinus communis TaxID=3988 RepID=B9S2R3_RICCO|nr:conserved hypothetical protein [Ricinus communis]